MIYLFYSINVKLKFISSFGQSIKPYNHQSINQSIVNCDKEFMPIVSQLIVQTSWIINKVKFTSRSWLLQMKKVWILRCTYLKCLLFFSFANSFVKRNQLNATHTASQRRFYEYFAIPRGEFLINLNWFGFRKMAYLIVKLIFDRYCNDWIRFLKLR